MGSRRLRLGLLTSAAGLAGVAFVVVLLSFLSRPEWRTRWEWSTTRTSTLSERCVGALRSLPAGARASAFLLRESGELQQNESAVYERAFAVLRTYLEDARIQTGGDLEVTIYEWDDLVAGGEAIRRLDRQPGEVLFLEAGDQRQILRFRELFEVQPPGMDGTPARLRKERVDEALTEAALRLGREGLIRVGVVSGYLSDLAPPKALDPLMGRLRAEGLEPVRIEGPESEEPIDLLWIPGQARPFPPAAAEAARAWVEAQRPLFVAVDFAAADEVYEFWNDALREVGLEFRRGLVCQPYQDRIAGRVVGVANCAILEVPWERLSATHPVTRRLAEAQRSTLVTDACEILILPGTNQFLREPVIRSMSEAWLETDPRPDYSPGSREPQEARNLLVAAERMLAEAGEGNGRLLAFGSAMLVNRPNALPFVWDWVSSGARWLLGEDFSFGGLTPLESRPFRLEPLDQVRLANLAILALPSATLLIGFLVFLRRRR